jgi:hypothetical protein
MSRGVVFLLSWINKIAQHRRDPDSAFQTALLTHTSWICIS